MAKQLGPTKRHPVTIERARRLRRIQTVTEMLLWRRLRNHRLNGLKFRRQVPIGPFIVDFYCAEANLIVELDGSAHDEQMVKMYDGQREKYLRENGYIVFRCTNDEVNDDIERVLRKIVEMCADAR